MFCPSLRSTVVTTALVCVLGISAGCRKADSTNPTAEQTTPSKPAASPLVGFAKDLQFIKDGNFTYIYVLSRKDKKPFDADDKEFLNKNAPQIVDRAATEDKMKIIVGTNFNLADEGKMDLLKKRYEIEDYSGR